jgi:hypothetical protein
MSEEGAPDHHRALASQGPKRPRMTKLARFFPILVFGVWAALTGVIIVCGRTPSDPHHIKFAEQRAMGRKVSDRFTVPICRLHHRELHRRGDERAWWQNQEIEPLTVAATLWAKTHAAPQAETEIEGERDRSAGINPRLNGRHFGKGAAAVGDRRQNNETKPIRGAEGG